MEKNILEQTNAQGVTTRYVEEDNGLPLRYLVAGGIGIAALVLMLKGSRKGKPSFFSKFVMPMIMAAAYKKGMDMLQNTLSSKEDAEIPAHARPAL